MTSAAATQPLIHPVFNEVKHRLKKEGKTRKTLKSFADEHGFKYRTVSDVVRGVRRGFHGEGREVRIALGLPVND